MFILLIGLVSLTWFRDNQLFSGTDTYFPQNRSSYAKSAFFAWDDRSYGSASVGISSLFPYGLFLTITEHIGLSLVTSQKMWFYYIFAGSGLSMFLLVSVVTRSLERKANYCLALLASMLFMFNPFVGSMATAYTYLWVTYAFLPLKLGLYIKGLRETRGFSYFVLMALVWIFASGSQYTNPKYLILDLLPILLFSVWYILSKNGSERIRAVKFSVVFFTLLTLFCSYWLLPTLTFIRQTFGDSGRAYAILGLSRDLGFSLNSATNLTNATRLIGLWALNGNFNGVTYFDWIVLYKQPALIILGMAMVAFTFVPFISRVKNRLYYYFLILNLISILGMMGLTGVLGRINLFLISKVPLYIDIFSYPYPIFGIYYTLSCSVLFSIGIYTLCCKLQLNEISKRIFAGVIMIAFVGVYGKPVWSGDLMSPRKPDTYQTIPSNLYTVPEYYYNTSNALKGERLESRIFSLPHSRTGGVVYLWKEGGYTGIDIASQLVGNVVYGVNPAVLLVNRLLVSDNTESFVKLLPILNTKYLLVHKDVHPVLYDKTVSYNNAVESNLKDTLKKGAYKTDFDKLELYRLNSSFFLPRLYTPQEIILIDDKSDSTSENLSSNFKARTGAFFKNQNLDNSALVNRLLNTHLETNSILTLEYKKINPIKYRVFIHSATGDFPLVFSESFHTGWKAYINKISPNQAKTGKVNVGLLNQYKILDGNQDDQVNKENLMGFIDNKWITTLGNGEEKQIKHLKWEAGKEGLDYIEKYNVDFISKNFQGTIQNDNLSSGHFWETWFPNRTVQIPEENHLMVNGYANSWVVDTDKLCGTNSFCTKNPDGTYDMELIVEFWPQRLFYMGAGISVTTLVVCIFYLIYSTILKNKRANMPSLLHNKIIQKI